MPKALQKKKALEAILAMTLSKGKEEQLLEVLPVIGLQQCVSYRRPAGSEITITKSEHS
jgi:hypothetical protein